MKTILVLLILTFILLSGCSDQKERTYCDRFKESFDENIDGPYAGQCENWHNGDNPIWVGGTLIDIEQHDVSTKKWIYELYFIGDKKKGIIYIETNITMLPYSLNRFYIFDLGNKCPYLNSGGSKGNLYLDEAMKEFAEINCSELK